MATGDKWICIGDINHPTGVYPHLSEFPVDRLRDMTPQIAAQRAKDKGIDPDDAVALAALRAHALAEFEADLQALIDCGSLVRPENAPVKGAQAASLLSAKDAEIARLRDLLAAQGVPSSIADRAGTSAVPPLDDGEV